MLKSVIRAVFGTRHQRELKRLQPLVVQINEQVARLESVSEEELKGQTEIFRERIREATAEVQAELDQLRAEKRAAESSAEREELAQRMGEVEKRLKAATEQILDEILPEAFATVKEACRRLVGTEVQVTGQTLTWDMVPYDVQLVGGTVLHQGKVAEMATGEGKTLVATLPLYLNALTGRGAHLVTVNSYLAQRDSEWMGHVYRYLGLTVGCIDLHEPNTPERREAYGADITYGTNNEYGFDYLRDNMVHALDQRVQRAHAYAIVDEVDSVLIDEARTPLIISGPSEESTDKYYVINKVIPGLIRDRDYTVDEKARSVVLTDEGVEKVESKLNVPNLYDPEKIETLHHVEQALRAHTLYRKDHEYVVKDGEVIIVDDFTGRLMPGRRWSDGLHQ
ncbi:MAG: preprotein translocase subunit SecA, partial [Longimicrobiaceae bacterium]